MFDYTAYELARMADVGCPDALDSAGAVWLLEVQDAATEATDSDSIWEAADGVVPVYTGELWAVFVDLAAYHEEIEFVQTKDESMTGTATTVLFQIAHRLISILRQEGDE